jgi:transposase
VARGKVTPYTTREQVQTLAAERISYRKIAQQLGMSKNTAHKWGNKSRKQFGTKT